MSWTLGDAPWMILDRFGKLHFYQNSHKSEPEILIYIVTYLYAHSIDLRFETWNPHHNNILHDKKNGVPNECRDFQESMQVDTKLFKTSQVFADLTSPALTPYYSIEQAGNMLYESLFNERKALESPRRDNTCASMGKFEKMLPKSRSERCFWWFLEDFSNVVPEASRTISVKNFHVFWHLEASGKLPRMVLDEFGELHFVHENFA